MKLCKLSSRRGEWSQKEGVEEEEQTIHYKRVYFVFVGKSNSKRQFKEG